MVLLVNSKYKNLLLDNYFNTLIYNNICKLEKTKSTIYNKTNVFYGTNGIYEFFTCDKKKFENQKINYKKNFMQLFFDLPKYNYIFNLNDDDLFMEINDKYYFLVAFPENINETNYIHCFLGLPFYQKYRLIFNFDSKTIGFYNQYSDQYNEDENMINEKNKNINNSSVNNRKRIIFEILFCFFLFFVAYFIGKKINEQRKKRANELNDDNFEYILENNKESNNKIIMEMTFNIK